MAILPGAVVGELLERLNAERRRVVLDGFEPNAGEWSSRWSRRASSRSDAHGPTSRGQAEADVLERIADDLVAEVPGQPTAAEIVLSLTMAIRRAPDQAAVIVDAMLTDHPRMAVVIVATALRLCPGLRKEILAQARRHKPFSRHPFILGILLAFVAHALAQNAAEAAETFEGTETPSEVLAALGRHYSAPRPNTDGSHGGRGDRAMGFGPFVAPAFVATVLAAGDAWSRSRPAEGERELADDGEGRRASLAAAEEEGTPQHTGVDSLAGDDGEDFRLRRPERQEEAAAERAESATPMFRPAPDDAAAPLATPLSPRAMTAAPSPAASAADGDAARGPASAEGAVAPASAAVIGAAAATPTTEADALADSVFDRVLARLSQSGDDPVASATILSELADQLSDLLGDRLDGDDKVVGSAGTDEPTLIGVATIEHGPAAQSADMVPAMDVAVQLPGAVIDAPVAVEPPAIDLAPVLDTGLVLDTELTLIGDDALVGADASATVEILGEDGLADVGAAVAVNLPGGTAATVGTELTLLDDDTVAELDVAAVVSVLEVVEIATDVGITIAGGDGVVAEASAELDLADIIIADIETELALLDDDTLAELDAAVALTVPEVVAITTDAGITIAGGDGIAAATATTLELGDTTIADVETGLALLDDATLAELDVAAAATVPDVVEITTDAGITIAGGDGIAAAAATTVELGDTIVADVDTALALLDGGTGAEAAIAVETPAATVQAAVEITPDAPPQLELALELDLDPLLSVDVAVDTGDADDDAGPIAVAIEVPVVQETVEAVESLLAAIIPDEPDPPPPLPVIPAIVPPVQSVVFALGGLFG